MTDAIHQIGTLGIIGGSGMLGGAIARGLLSAGLPEASLILTNRSGARDGFDAFPDVRVTTDVRELTGCDVVLLAVPPAQAGNIGLTAPGTLIVSAMAGVTRDHLTRLTGSPRVVRAMSSPAAEQRLAYSPWITSASVSDADKTRIRALFGAIGETDEVFDEAHIDHFTAMTGPVPGFVAYFARAVAQHATAQGIPPEVADRATRQLFLAAGQMMATGKPPAQHVQEMIDYAGTTAAGLLAMEDSPLSQAISDGLMAAYDKATKIA